MRRYQYRLNDQNVSLANWGRITPLKYIETVPGETYGGSITVKATSAVANKAIFSRAYYDLYAFYCPIRVLWDQFPYHLASREDELPAPTTETLFPQNFESSFVGDATSNAAFLRRMYHMISRTFFSIDKGLGGNRLVSKLQDQIRAGEFDQDNHLHLALGRGSTFDRSWLTSTSVEQQTVPVNDGAVSLQMIRRAYSLDRYEKLRDYYGGRYTDLLKGYGVKADWGILQEPECIGISNNDWKFNQKTNLDSELAQRNGYFEQEFSLKIRKTFCPEHGILGFYAVPRADVFNTNQPTHILGTRVGGNPSAWWDPHVMDTYTDAVTPATNIDAGAARGSTVSIINGDHLRKGRNEVAVPAGTDWNKLPVFGRDMTSAITNHDLWLRTGCQPDAADFAAKSVPADTDDMALPESTEVCHYTETRLSKRSPVKPAGMSIANR